MKKIAISLLVLALVAAFSATGVVSAATCAATTTACPSTTSAACTSCVTSTCCCCPCPVVTCCCPVVTTCVVTKCCEVKTVVKTVVKAAPVKDGDHKDGKPAAGAVATKGGVAANNGGIAVSQELKQSNEANVKVEGIGNTVDIIQTNAAEQMSLVVPVKINIEDITINPNLAWNGGQIGDNTATDSFNDEVLVVVPPVAPG